jgi:hypothetical protein
MIERLTAADIANEMSMMRSSFKGTFVVVEGVTDSRLYGKFIDEGVMVLIAHSKDNVRRAVTESRVNRRDLRIIGIMDPDLDRMNGNTYAVPLFLTDNRDLEGMILGSRALDDLLTEYADPELLRAFEERHGPVRDVIARAALPIGLLMHISHNDGLKLCFKDLDYRAFIDPCSLEIDLPRMVEEVLALSKNPGTGRKDALARLGRELKRAEDPWIAVRGHDAVEVLAIGLSEAFGSYNCKCIKHGQVAGSLRLAFSYDYFAETDLYGETAEWSRISHNPLWLSR